MRMMYFIWVLIFSISILLMSIIQADCESNDIDSQHHSSTDNIANEIVSQVSNDIKIRMEEFFKRIQNAIVITIPDSEKRIVYIAPGEEIGADVGLLTSSKYKTEVGDINKKVKE